MTRAQTSQQLVPVSSLTAVDRAPPTSTTTTTPGHSGDPAQTRTHSQSSREAPSSTATALPRPSSTTSGSKPTQHAHPPIAAIVSVIAVLLLALLALLAASYLYVRRLRRRRANTTTSSPCPIVKTGDDGPSSLGTSLAQDQRIPDDSDTTKSQQRPATTPWEAPPSWATSPSLLTSAPAHHVLGAGPPTGNRAASALEHRPLLRHSTASASSSLAPTLDLESCSSSSSTTGDDVVEYGRLVSHTTLDVDDVNARPMPAAQDVASHAMRDSWESDGDSDDPGPARTATSISSTGWHPSRMVRSPPPPPLPT
ncbi:hypothetical protein C8Q73DRAFT_668409 [Cubamyces lactineus]|nr:hypothetical protein C8Q73DRAFT_668409 [Cubamyces lactineus]